MQTFPPLPNEPHPAQQQFSQQDHFFGQLLRLLFIHVAESLSPEELETLMSLQPDDPRATQLLHNHSNQRHAKLMGRNRGSRAAPQPTERPRMGNGKIDHSLEATRAVHALFNNALKGGR
jgi:hypothetical protein